MNDLLNLPILSMSKFIIENKREYYKLLQTVRKNNGWEDWLLYMIEAVEIIAKETIIQIGLIKELMMEFKQTLRNNYKFYSQDLLNILFERPYTKIEFIERDLGVSRITAANYLNRLAKDGLLVKKKLGAGNYYINDRLFAILTKNTI